ncbi:lysosomal Pro-X carboxypeptidase [Morus notabilis]|uniref:lysosomal Pro-X carboxypeptidase n=1 Tax=Morus notabilis TaxID=981085 RepID=UPI000CED3E99|nr:lysosomal Pro-X carboxypeptidase [Morus notabilis]
MKTSRIISWHLCLQFLSLPFLFFAVFSSASKLNKIPKLSPTGHHETFLHDPETPTADSLSEDYETFFYNQTLDHFNYRPESYSTFRQRYVVNSKYWGGSNAPIFAYLGAEAPLDGDLSVIGFLTDNALEFKALQIYIEHRYYGKSIPYGSREEALNNASTLGYFNSAQAIADYAEILLHVKQKFHAEKSPVIVIGGSYGGMLASWFRLKYPHIALGALASSAPILYFDNITSQDGYYSIVTKDFIEASESCYKIIKKSWSEIDKVAALPNGLSLLSKKFHTCRPLKKSSELKDHLESTYATAAQYNHPPRYPVNVICGAIDGANNDDGILGKIFAGLASYRTNRTCYVNQPRNLSETDVGWNWQTCSEMVIPIGISNNTMFPASPFELQDFINECKAAYDVPPRPHWVTTYYGGKDIKLILRRFASNIIFSNGLRDPYSSGGVLENISKSVVAVTTTKGSHCLDILQAKETDPDWLVKQRKVEVNIIKRWIAQYYFDLEVLRKIPS